MFVCVRDTVQAVNKHAGVTFVKQHLAEIIKILHASTIWLCKPGAQTQIHIVTACRMGEERERETRKTELFIPKVMGSTSVSC